MKTKEEVLEALKESGALRKIEPVTENEAGEIFKLDASRIYRDPRLVTAIALLMADVIWQTEAQKPHSHKIEPYHDVIVSPEKEALMLGSRVAEILTLLDEKAFARKRDPIRFAWAERRKKGALIVNPHYADTFSNHSPVVIVTDMVRDGDTLMAMAEGLRKVDGILVGVMTAFRSQPTEKTLLAIPKLGYFKVLFDDVCII